MRSKFLIIIALAFSACASNDKSVVQEYAINGEVINTKKMIYDKPYSMIYDSRDGTILLNISRGKYNLQRVDPKSGNVKEFLGIGRGRNECIDFDMNYIDNSGVIYGRDFPMIVGVAPAGEVISQQTVTPENRINIIRFNQINNDYIIYGNFNHPKKLFTVFDSSWHERGAFGEFPSDGISEAEGGQNGKIMAYQGYILCSDSHSRVAYVSRAGEFLTIYSIDKEHNTEEIFRIERNLPKYEAAPGPGSGVVHIGREFYYVDAYSTENYIYVLYSGKTMEEISSAAFMEASLSNTIMVYDWSGEHLYDLKTDLDLLKICVSDNDKELYAISMNDEYEFKLCQFEIDIIK